VIPNRDVISTETFIKKHNKYHYNSFIFGSSRTLAYTPEAWRKHLSPDASPFIFDASGESVYGIYIKLKYLDSLHIDIRNVLIVLCHDVSFSYSKNPEGHLFIKDPNLSGESALVFQSVFFKSYLEPKFLYPFYSYLITGKYQPYMKGFIENRKILYDTVTNKVRILDQESEINNNPAKYYLDRKDVFYERKDETIDRTLRINEEYQVFLKKIKNLLDKNKTQYKIVLSPLYDQIKFNNKDLSFLKNLFGPHLYDFSGKNTFTASKYNYFESSHYRPIVGDSILNIIYSK